MEYKSREEPHRRASQNLVHILMDREHGIDRKYPIHRRPPHVYSLEFYKSIVPNLTISNISVWSYTYFRKFSPDGKYLIAFSRDLRCLECFKFRGTASAADLVYPWKSEFISPDNTSGLGMGIRQNIFKRLFKFAWTKKVTVYGRPLHREFSIFTDDCDYVIIACTRALPEEELPAFYRLNSMHKNQFKHNLHWYRFMIVRLSDGFITDSMDYPIDCINLTNHHGSSLNKNTIALVSMYYQWIYIFKIINGKYQSTNIVQQYVHGYGDCVCRDVPEYRKECMIMDTKFGGIRQKVLIGFYKDILRTTSGREQGKAIQQFYKNYPMYLNMEMQKVQLIDDDHIFIRLEYPAQLNGTEMKNIYAVYDFEKNETVKVFRHNSVDLLKYMMCFHEAFYSNRNKFTGCSPSIAGSDIFARHYFMRIISLHRSWKRAAAQLLPQFPLPPQMFSTSAYLDQNLYKYDPVLISSMERPRYFTGNAVRFICRDTNITKFRLYPSVAKEYEGDTPDELVTYLFHPFEPIIISMHKNLHTYVINVHIRNEGTQVTL